jgi:hypothetical protein
MSLGTITLTEILSAKAYSQLTHPCAICKRPVYLSSATSTDENSRAVHADCLRDQHYNLRQAA